MKSATGSILVINGGSSSIKFALYQVEKNLQKKLFGKIDRIALSNTTLTFTDSENQQSRLAIEASDNQSAVNFLIEWLSKKIDFANVRAIGHRVVYGMEYTEPQKITQEVLDELHRMSFYDPDHLPSEIKLIEMFRQRYPQMLQMAFFDTEFHCHMPRVAQLLPIPRRFDRMGIRRYGFHGLSYAYLMEELFSIGGEEIFKGRVILAHLGNGASLAAVFQGKSVDTSMGFTPTGGLVMSTRTGDLDPGVLAYLLRTQHLTAEQFSDLINHQSGLHGVSETSSNMQDLIELQQKDVRAAEAVELFCYQTRKFIGSFAAVLEGLDTLVFSGGIGENSPEIRLRICKVLGFLGVKLCEVKNRTNAAIISSEDSKVSVRVIKTDEELMIAKGLERKIK